MQDGRKAIWSIPYVSVAFFPSFKQNFIAYRSSKMSSRPYCIFEIHQPWQSGFSRVYSNSCCSRSFEPEIIKIGQSSLKIYSINIVNSQESTTILNACTKKSGNLLKAPCNYSYIIKYLNNHVIISVDKIYRSNRPNKTQILHQFQKCMNIVEKPLHNWGCEIHLLHLCRELDATPHEYPGYDTKQSDGEVLVMLELLGIWSTSSMPLRPGPPWPEVLISDRALSMGQIELICILMLS